jgi:osmotically-inducible protein OsmY
MTSNGTLAAFVAGSGVGMAVEYFLDPADGKRRRHMLRDRTTATLRRGSREAQRQARYMGGKAQGVVAEATPPGRDSSELNDPGLEAKVESELFRPAEAPKGSVDVNVERGVVYLRGEVEDRQRIEALVERARAVDGVSKVVSLLHVPGEPAPEAV